MTVFGDPPEFREGLLFADARRYSLELNSHLERRIRIRKSEFLKWMIFFGEPSLRRALRQYIEHYHTERNYQGSGNRIIEPAERSGAWQQRSHAANGCADCGDNTTAMRRDDRSEDSFSLHGHVVNSVRFGATFDRCPWMQPWISAEF